MKTTVWVDSEEVEALEALKLHEKEPLGNVIHRLRVANSSKTEADAFEAAERRFEAYLEKCRENQADVVRAELRKKNAESAERTRKIKRELGIDAGKETVPAWGFKQENEG